MVISQAFQLTLSYTNMAIIVIMVIMGTLLLKIEFI